MGLRFTPPVGSARYALYIEGTPKWNRTNFRTYDRLADAKNGYHSAYAKNGAKILEMVDGEWFVLYDIPGGTQRENVPWYKEVRQYQSWDYQTTTVRKAVPMTRDEYASWRISVEKERLSRLSSIDKFFSGRLPVPGLREKDHAHA